MAKIFNIITGHGVTGMQINLNMEQCIALAQFAHAVTVLKQEEVFNYPDNIQPFLDKFEQFSIIDNENLFNDEDSVKSTGLYTGNRPLRHDSEAGL